MYYYVMLPTLRMMCILQNNGTPSYRIMLHDLLHVHNGTHAKCLLFKHCV